MEAARIRKLFESLKVKGLINKKYQKIITNQMEKFGIFDLQSTTEGEDIEREIQIPNEGMTGLNKNAYFLPEVTGSRVGFNDQRSHAGVGKIDFGGMNTRKESIASTADTEISHPKASTEPIGLQRREEQKIDKRKKKQSARSTNPTVSQGKPERDKCFQCNKLMMSQNGELLLNCGHAFHIKCCEPLLKHQQCSFCQNPLSKEHIQQIQDYLQTKSQLLQFKSFKQLQQKIKADFEKCENTKILALHCCDNKTSVKNLLKKIIENKFRIFDGKIFSFSLIYSIKYKY